MTDSSGGKPVGWGHLIGPVIERDDADPYFVMALGSARTFEMDYIIRASCRQGERVAHHHAALGAEHTRRRRGVR